MSKNNISLCKNNTGMDVYSEIRCVEDARPHFSLEILWENRPLPIRPYVLRGEIVDGSVGILFYSEFKPDAAGAVVISSATCALDSITRLTLMDLIPETLTPLFVFPKES